jgi:putative transposase
MDNQNVKLSDLYKQCAILAKEFAWAGKLNSMARQAMAQRAIFAIQRFFANCFRQQTWKERVPAVQEVHTLCGVQNFRMEAFF